jgi:hypothetical protein
MNMDIQKLRFLPLALLLHAACAGENGPQWQSDAQHPLLEYRFQCGKGAETVFWRSGYPGAVTLKARMRSSSYDGVEDVRIEAQGVAHSDLDTLYCGRFQVTVSSFSMSPPPIPRPLAPKPPAAVDANATVQPTVPTLLRFEPRTEPLPQITLEALEFVQTGMTEAEVLQNLGEPLSKMSIPEDGALIETYRYNVVRGRTGIVRFANGIVTGIVSPISM